MGQINLYKIDSTKQKLFYKELKGKYSDPIRKKVVKQVNATKKTYDLSLYMFASDKENQLEWQWLLDYFAGDKKTNRQNPKSILVISDGITHFACTFGYSFFSADKFCDTDYAFNFARKVEYTDIKATALSDPTSKRNKSINTYIDYSDLEFSSGEAFSKIKGKIKLPKKFDLFEPAISIGHSLRFMIKKDDINTIIETICYVEKISKRKNDNYKIPIFNKVTDKELIKVLRTELLTNIGKEAVSISFSELDIIGTTEIFNNNDSEFLFKYGKASEAHSNISFESFVEFSKKNKVELLKAIEKVNIISKNMGQAVRSNKLIDLLDYTSDAKRCVLSKGQWYHYNDDYLDYLKDSIKEIEVVYNKKYNFSNIEYMKFIDEKILKEKDCPEFKNLSETQVKEKLSRKYYPEFAFNNIRKDKDSFKIYDRELQNVGKSKIEVMDLYKDDSMIAVKIGNTSSQLCYVIDQSLAALKLLQHKKVVVEKEIKNIVIWLVLEREKELELNEKQQPDINDLNMLLLKNKIAGWKREVRLAGYTPKIYINYRKKG